MKTFFYKTAVYMSIVMSLLVYPIFTLAQKPSGKEAPGRAIFVMASLCDDVPRVETETRRFEVRNDSILLDMKIPQLKGLSNLKFEKAFNKTLLKEAQKRKKQKVQEAAAYHKELIKDGLEGIKFEYIENYALIEAPSRYASLAFLRYEYSGGAHGMSYQSYITFDLENSQVVTLADLFKDEIPIKVINEAINAQIKERMQQGIYFFTGANGFTGLKGSEQFYVNHCGEIVIVFNLYEIAPYASGITEFPIPKDVLLPYLK